MENNISISQLINELKIEHELILKFMNEMFDNNIDINEFKKYLLHHLEKEHSILYPEFQRLTKNTDKINNYINMFVGLNTASLEVIDRGNKEEIMELFDLIKQRIKFEEDVMFSMLDD